MDDKENNPNLQQPNEPSQPIFETVPEDGAPPEEIASSVATTDQTDFTEIKPEIAPIAENTVSHSNNVGKVLIMVGGLGVFFLVFLVLFVALSGGSKKKKSDVPQPVALTYWGLWEEKEVIDPLIKEYQKTHPNVQITYEKKSEVDYRKKLLTWIQNGQGPDIFRFHNTWVPEMLLPDPSTSQMALASLPESVL